MNAAPPIEQIVARSRDRVVSSLVRGYGLSVERAEELCHDAVLLLLRKVRQGDLAYASGAILLKLARGLAANERRTASTRARIRRDHERELGAAPVAPDTSVLPPRLLHALAEVEPLHAEIFLRRVVLGESAREVGRRVGLTPGSVDRRRDGVTQALREALEAPERRHKGAPVALAELLRSLRAHASAWWSGRRTLAVLLASVVAGVMAQPPIPVRVVPTTVWSHTEVEPVGPVVVGLTVLVGPIPSASGLHARAHASLAAVAVHDPQSLGFEPLVAMREVADRGERSPVAAVLEEDVPDTPRCPGTTPEEDADCEDLVEQAAVVGALERASRRRDWQAALTIASLYLERWPWGELEPTVRIHHAHALRAEAMWEELLQSVAVARQDPAYASMTAKLEHWSIEAMAHTGRCEDVWSGVRAGRFETVSRRTARALCEGRLVAGR